MSEKLSLVLAAGVLLVLVGCGSGTPLDAAEATEEFGACLDRNGIVYQDLQVELDAAGTVETLTVQIVSESDVAYEPAVRLACTEEVERAASSG